MLKDRVRQARLAKGWTHEDLAATLRPPVTRTTVSHWEAGRTRPKRDNLFRLARLLGVSAEWLTGESKEGGPEGTAEPALRRDLLRRVEIALETYLQAHDLRLAPEDRWEAVEAVYEWAEDLERLHGPDQPIKVESVRAFLRRLRSPPAAG